MFILCKCLRKFDSIKTQLDRCASVKCLLYYIAEIDDDERDLGKARGDIYKRRAYPAAVNTHIGALCNRCSLSLSPPHTHERRNSKTELMTNHCYRLINDQLYYIM